MKTFRVPFRSTIFIILLCSLLAGMIGFERLSVVAAPQQANTNHVVISEFRTRGSTAGGGAYDEFIEIYNPTGVEVEISNWRINKSAGCPSTSVTTLVTIPDNTFLPSGEYYLVASAGSSLATFADQTFLANTTYALPNNGGIAILDLDGSTIVDQVGMCSTAFYKEGGTLPALTADNEQSYERKLGGAGGNCIDTDDNASDFIFNASSSNPQNSDSPAVACGFSPLSVVISEVAWGGTQISEDDEWIELYNPGSSPVDLTDWYLATSDGDFYHLFTGGEIPAGGYFLLERGRDLVVKDVSADLVYDGNDILNDFDVILRLRAPDGTVVDTANSDGNAWPAGENSGNRGSMERLGPTILPDGPFAWITNDGSVRNGIDAADNPIYGTPGQPNWGFSVTMTPTPTSTSTATATSTSTSTPTPTATSTPEYIAAMTVIISEVAWAGTKFSSNDEWMELHNPGSEDVDLTGWRLEVHPLTGTTKQSINLNAVILPAGGYYLLERSDDLVVKDVAADQIYPFEISLNNSGEILKLIAPGPTGDITVDTANSDGGLWPAGGGINYASMERRKGIADSMAAWITNTGVVKNGIDNGDYEIYGTPRQANWAFSVTPTASPQPTSTRTPLPTRTATPLPGLVVLNEILPRPGHDWDGDGEVNVFDEYVELINIGSQVVDLKGWRLDDEANKDSPPYTFPSITIKPGEKLVFHASLTGIRLSDAGDTVRLLFQRGDVADAYTYTVVKEADQTWCRMPDGRGLWISPCGATPGQINSLESSFPPPTGAPPKIVLKTCLFRDTLSTMFSDPECEIPGLSIFSKDYFGYSEKSPLWILDMFKFPVIVY